ncbi:MAG: sigma-E factor negative regulatory protein [Gammaproteobacteria bacterium]|nr:sigma-E factor negative regulatory protein [Gammaproteobacteria bacterium]
MNEQVGSKMRETLSALMDDEASELELHRAMREAGENECFNATWSRYHLAASAMRKELPLDFDDSSAKLRAAINMALISEPVPQRTPQWPQSLGRVAIAASVAVLAIFGAQQYRVFEPSSSMPLIAQGETQGQLQIRTGEVESEGSQFQLPSGFEVPQATARTASTASFRSNSYARPARIEAQPSANRLEMERQIQAYMQGLMSQQAERNYRHSNSIFLPAEHGSQHAIEP